MRQARALVDCFRGGDSLELSFALPDKLIAEIDPDNGIELLRAVDTRVDADVLLCDSAGAARLFPNPADGPTRVGLVEVGDAKILIFDIRGVNW